MLSPASLFRLSRCFILMVLLGLALAAGSGCTRRFPTERVPQVKLLLVPFEQPPAMATEPRAIRGWWFGETIVRQNTRAGEAMSDALNRAFSRITYVNLYSPIEIKYYFADKEQLLRKAYPYLEDPEVKRLMADVPPQDYARELGADKVLSGRIIRQYMGERVWSNWWWARLEADVYVMDVGTGQREWSKTYKIHKQFASDARLQEELALRVIKDLQREYFAPMTRR